MGLLRRLAGFLGFPKDDGHEVKDEVEDDLGPDSHRVESHLHRKGFSVPVQVPVERPQLGPVLVPCIVGDGGVQGLKWYAKRLKIDEEGDVADEFLDEILPEPTSASDMVDQHRPFPRFEVKFVARPAKVRKQALAADGKIQQGVEYQGKLQWV
ncbi:hypothetical protein CsSME_00044545 [Camellia sinensis var. sinensis]|uniref:uncharacterized protein LOC114308522 n=1 Tax=Camellia sinensis TaxID=4442 RepID=UPI001035564D|nr:uncharacterized protein LOC114308522 [Camellia sinensis]